MSTDQVRIERRAAQRFDFQVPVSVRISGSDCEAGGFTQNLSARGVFFHTDLPLSQADAVDVTLVMPAEITFAENMRVCCRGKVLRVLSSGIETRSVVAVQLSGYEFLPQPTEGSSEWDRIHPVPQSGDESSPLRPVVHSSHARSLG